jgi:dynein heavy chain
MVMYHFAAKIVKPKMDFLKVQEARLAKAMAELDAAEAVLKKVMDEVAELDAQLQEAMDTKNALEANAMAMKRKMDAANKLLSGLSGENARWTEDAKNFAVRRKRLVGDVALACGFVTFCGPFNSEFRDKLNYNLFLADTHKRKVPASEKVNLVEFLVDQGTIGEWALEGLPSDDLSVQNAIMVTRSSRYALMVDPQGQALRWIKTKEAERVSAAPAQCITTLAARNLKDQIEFCMGEGLPLIIENVENEVDPMLDPVMDKAIIKKGKNMYINVSDQNMDYSPKFTLYMTSRLPNPHFSPELSAKCTVIDFTVTLRGLEQQLLGRVLQMEQKALEDSLAALKEDVTNNTKSLQLLDKQLLERLSNSTGNLLDDTELIEVLANTKAKAKEVEGKLAEAAEREIEINEKREQFRPVATRGSIMYFNMTDMTLVANPITCQPSGWMYNCSLMQFLEQFDFSIKNSEKCQPTSKRVDKIIQYLTYKVYRYMNRGLFERDKLMFKLMVTLKIMVIASSLTGGDVSVFLKAGSSLDKNSERPNPFKWMSDKVWLNCIVLTRHSFGTAQVLFFRELVDFMQRSEAAWKKWFDENEPENCPVPDYEERIVMERTLGAFVRMVLVRSIREDRTSVACQQFINEQLDPKFTSPVTDAIAEIFEESTNRKPVLYLLTAGSDPTMSIDELAKKKKKFPTDKVSMGEGQEKVAREKNNAAFLTGGWVILQNCHLGIGYMNEMEDVLTKTPEIDEDFRLWITCEITLRFPIGLLQMAIKVTLEPPAGLKAGLSRTYTTMVSQELLDKVDHQKWRTIVYVQSFLHSVVQERRKFGPIGWCVPYEYNNSDLDACLLFLEKHLSTTIMVGYQLSWVTIQYMVAEAQYGGRITDDLDRELFITYTAKWFTDEIWKAGFTFNNYQAEYNYKIPDGLEIQLFRDSIDTIPPVDSPNIFGLHTNADLTYRLKEASEMLATIIETQPKDTGGGSGKSVDEVVKDQCLQLLEQMPPDFVEEIFRAQITKLKGPPGCGDKGFSAPLNIFLFQELQRLQNIIRIVRSNLKNLAMAIDGTVVMTTDLLEDLNSVFDARVPKKWTHDPSGAEISWLLPTIGSWFTGMLERQVMLNTWLENDRKSMKAYWLTGFTNAQGFLTGMRQEVTRQHKKDQWALDDVVTHTEVLAMDYERLKDCPDEGQNIYGLFIEGGRWNRQEGKLDESEPKKLFLGMPVIFVTAMTAKDLKSAGLNYGPNGPYNCAVYKYPKRNDRYLIFRLFLRTDEKNHPFHWRLRGVCLWHRQSEFAAPPQVHHSSGSHSRFIFILVSPTLHAW